MSIKSEITELRNLCATVLPANTKYLLQQDLKSSAVDYVAIKRLDAEYGIDITNTMYSNSFTYRFIIYANTELDAHSRAEKIARILSQDKKIPIMEENSWITLGSFATAESFETEKSGVFALVGLIKATLVVVKTKEEEEKLLRIYVRYQEEIKL